MKWYIDSAKTRTNEETGGKLTYNRGQDNDIDDVDSTDFPINFFLISTIYILILIFDNYLFYTPKSRWLLAIHKIPRHE